MNATQKADTDYRRFLDPQILARLDRLDLVAKYAVEGFIAGLHKSPFHGFSSEFSEHRQYIPGDPLKHLDWKVLARTNRPYLKRFEDETNVQTHILLDRSGTMSYGSGVTSKWTYARMLSASIAYLLLKQRDAVGMALFDERVTSWIPPRSVPGHLEVLLREIDKTAAEHRTDPMQALHRLAERIHRRGLIVLVSDLLLPPATAGSEPEDTASMVDRWLSVLKHFRHAGHDVIVYHVMHGDEVDFDFDGPVAFDGLEGEGRLMVDTNSLGHLYRSQVQSFLDLIQRGCRGNHVDYHMLRTDESLGHALAACMDLRKRLH